MPSSHDRHRSVRQFCPWMVSVLSTSYREQPCWKGCTRWRRAEQFFLSFANFMVFRLVCGGQWRRNTHCDAGRGGKAGRRSDALALFIGSTWSSAVCGFCNVAWGTSVCVFGRRVCGVRARESVLLAQPSAHSSLGFRSYWNRAGEEPPGCQYLTVEARLADPTAVVWKGGEDVPQGSRGIRILGTPLGHSEHVVAQLQEMIESHRTLLDRIPALTDLQSAWLLLLFCGTSRANYSLRVVHPCLTESFARQHDAGVWQCLCTLFARP